MTVFSLCALEMLHYPLIWFVSNEKYILIRILEHIRRNKTSWALRRRRKFFKITLNICLKMNYHIYDSKDGIICHFEEDNSGRLGTRLGMILSPYIYFGSTKLSKKWGLNRFFPPMLSWIRWWELLILGEIKNSSKRSGKEMYNKIWSVLEALNKSDKQALSSRTQQEKWQTW